MNKKKPSLEERIAAIETAVQRLDADMRDRFTQLAAEMTLAMQDLETKALEDLETKLRVRLREKSR